MLMKCWGNGWSAEIIGSDEISPDGLVHFQCKTCGVTQDDALNAAKYLLQVLAGGRESYIRIRPEASSDREFDTKETYHHGYTRFAVQTTPDKQIILPDEIAQLPLSAA